MSPMEKHRQDFDKRKKELEIYAGVLDDSKQTTYLIALLIHAEHKAKLIEEELTLERKVNTKFAQVLKDAVYAS